MAIGWQGRAIWPTEGTEDGGRNLELELKVQRARAGAKHEHDQESEQAPEPELRQSSVLARDLARWLLWRMGACSPHRSKAAGIRPVACSPHELRLPPC